MRITLKDGKGGNDTVAGFQARSPDQAAEMDKDQAISYRVEEILDELDKLHGKAESFMPRHFAATAQKIASLSEELQLKLKDYYGMGANYTVYEMAMIKAQIPTADWSEKFKAYKVKSNLLRGQFIGTLRAKYKAYSRGGTPQAVTPAAKPPTGLQKGFAKK